jgi:DNA-binding response OmpR family regulator
VIEDDVKTAGALENGLRGEGFLPAVAKSGEEGLSLASTEDFDIIVLDWLLPGRDGLEVLKILRSRGCRTPVLLLTARDAVEDRVLGLDTGADDYLVKPFAFHRTGSSTSRASAACRSSSQVKCSRSFATAINSSRWRTRRLPKPAT